MKFNNLDLKCSHKWLARSFSLVCCSALIVSSAYADQITVLDNLGEQRSVAEIQPGSSASVSVIIAGKDSSAENVSVSLIDKNKQTVSTAGTNTQGVAKLSGIHAGTYSIALQNKDVVVSNVIIQQATPSNSAKSLSKNDTTALYVGGVSALGAGAVAIASGSGSSNGDRANLSGSGSLVNTTPGSTNSRVSGTPLAPQTRDDSNGDGLEDAPGTDPGDINNDPTGGNITTNDPVGNVTGAGGPGTGTDGSDDDDSDLDDSAGSSGSAPAAPTPTPAPPLSGS